MRHLGEYLIEDGAITPEALTVALARQQAREKEGRPQRLGEVLTEMGAASAEQVDRAVERQRKDRDQAAS